MLPPADLPSLTSEYVSAAARARAGPAHIITYIMPRAYMHPDRAARAAGGPGVEIRFRILGIQASDRPGDRRSRPLPSWRWTADPAPGRFDATRRPGHGPNLGAMHGG